ncbi:MAG: hypothetical protein V7734_07660 [Maribacter arcticus]|uniref:hypothetical protein n=1 Tax=Maribacter arcticus TaxID=561365 RepID=UPI003001BB1B
MYKDLLFIEGTHQIKSRKTTKKYISALLEMQFLIYNARTGYYLIKAFDKIRSMQHFKTRLAFPIGYQNYNKLDAVTGAVLYGYLHKDFWRKVKQKKSVQIKGCTYYFPKVNFNYKTQLAPVSVYGLKQIFNIPIATASRLKSAAKSEHYLKVKTNYEKISSDKAFIMNKVDETDNLRYKNGKYYLQLIDTVCPLFYFIKRKSLE